MVAEWREDLYIIISLNGYDAELAAEAITLGLKLAESQPKKVLLHGDFYPGNVLASQREPWLVIDPKPLIGDPAYDLAQWIHNRYFAASLKANAAAVLRDQIVRFADRLSLNPLRIAGWTFVKSVGWESPPQAVSVYHEVLKTFNVG